MLTLAESHAVKRLILVSFETESRVLANNVLSLPWTMFLKMLWNGEII
jgi:hypothetical protein